MSQRDRSERQFQSRSPPRTERPAPRERDDPLRPQHTERQLHQESPTRHDVQFYVRKVNRYEAQLAHLEHELSVTKFRLSKAEDFQAKYELLFKENQQTLADYIDTREQLEETRNKLDRLQLDHEQAHLGIKALKNDLEIQRRNKQELISKKQELRSKTTNQGQEERVALTEIFNKEIENLKQQSRESSEKMRKEIAQLQSTVNMKETIEKALAAKLQHIKKEKNSEIQRLKQLVSGLRDQLSQSHCNNQDRARKSREDLIGETEARIANVRRLAQVIEETLVEEINNLNITLTKKNEEIRFLIACDKRQLEDHENAENSLRTLVGKLEDKIFTIQRENELELYETIQRLKNQYNDNLAKANYEWDETRKVHQTAIEMLRRQIAEQRKEIELLNSENLHLEGRHKELSRDQQHSVQMLSQKILSLEAERDDNLRNYTTSMKQIEDDAKSKLEDLHTAIQNKNTESQILNQQLTLKNGEITHLLDQISRLRELNREKVKKLQNTNASEQNALNNQISELKRRVLQIKRANHELQAQITDDQAAHKLEQELLKADLQSQKEANALLTARNNFLKEWCEELDRDLKAERVANVNILHDQNISKRENVQTREQVRVDLEAVKNKDMEQLKNVHKLEKTRLEGEINKKDIQLRDKKEELARLLVQYKGLEAKIGKSSKLDRSAEDEGRCRATLQAQILLTENIFRAINVSNENVSHK